jgi:hypothetical protein
MFSCISCLRPSAGRVSAADAVCKSIDIFRTLRLNLNNLNRFSLLKLFICFVVLVFVLVLTLYRNMLLCIRGLYLCILGNKIGSFIQREPHLLGARL